jgi:lysophospholipid acyltransferase (LPLAT)-like uncharacterized protein
VREKILGFLAWIFFSILVKTWKIQLIESEEMQRFLKNKTPFIMAHWHGDELMLVHLARRYRMATLSSKSKDGEIMAYVLGKLGAVVVRGSSSRGAVSGLLGLIKLIKKGHVSSFAVDGPKGPRYKAKPGIVETSKNLKIPIICGSAYCDRAWVFEKAWNKAILPKPFARLCIVWTKPFDLIPQDTDANDPILLKKVEDSLHAAKQQALGIIAGSAS